MWVGLFECMFPIPVGGALPFEVRVDVLRPDIIPLFFCQRLPGRVIEIGNVFDFIATLRDNYMPAKGCPNGVAWFVVFQI